jgi:hypothetical protein
MSWIRTFVLWTAIPGTGLFSAHAQTGSAFPIVGIASGQTARLNILNIAPPNPSSQSSCNVTLQFLAADGAVLKQSRNNLSPGGSALLDLNWNDLSGYSLRAEIRAVLLFGYSGGANPPGRIVQQTACGSLVPSLEVFNASDGKTILILTHPLPLPAPTKPLP